VKKSKKKNWGQDYLASANLFRFLQKGDANLAEEWRRKGCLHCGGPLHQSNYPRKPRGGPEDSIPQWRLSLCCAVEGCRKRHTPPSLRFLGRRVYWSPVVILISALRHGLNPQRVKTLTQSLGIDRRTLERWRQWWLEDFVQSSFWKAIRARFMPSVDEAQLPLSLCHAFDLDRQDRLLDLLQFLAPITTASIPLERLI
jgi:hypothetical protein